MQQPTDADSTFDDLVRRQIINAYGLDADAAEEVFSTEPGSYGAAHAEYQAQYEAFKAAVPARAEEFAAGYAAGLIACGRLPEGVTMRWERADN